MNDEDFDALVRFYIGSPEGRHNEANAFINNTPHENEWRKFVTESSEKAAKLCAAYFNAGIQIGWDRAKELAKIDWQETKCTDECGPEPPIIWPDISEVEF